MITLETRLCVEGITPREVTDFLLNPSDDAYRAWWPGTHLEFHRLRRGSGVAHVGDIVWMDELVGSRRVRMAAQVVQAEPGETVVWRARRWGLRLPVRITVAVRPEDRGVALCHTITAGWRGPGRVLDPLWRLYLSDSFAIAMDEHARTEFQRLPTLLEGSADQHPLAESRHDAAPSQLVTDPPGQRNR